MRVVASEFKRLDGVVQAPGGPDEDTSGGECRRHGARAQGQACRRRLHPQQLVVVPGTRSTIGARRSVLCGGQ